MSATVFPVQMQTAIGLAALVLAFVVYKYAIASRRRLPLFPGPWRYPIIGNVPQMPKVYPWLTYERWSKQYGVCNRRHCRFVYKYIAGDVIFLSALGKPILIINSFKAAQDLLIGRGTKYADRPVLPMAGQLYVNISISN